MGIGSGVQVSAWIKICDNTAIAYHVFDHGLVEFSLGSDVDLVATERGLHNLVTHAQEALRSVQNAVDRNNGSCQTA
ncbi:MAG: hypothetical protein ACRDRO_07630 [Pseudonocardiaceae bacterium]